MVNTIEETTYPDDKNILFYYLSMSSLQNKTKNCLRDKFFFTLAKSNCTYFVRMSLKFLSPALSEHSLSLMRYGLTNDTVLAEKCSYRSDLKHFVAG